jgi:hypothetical protein
MSQAHINFPSGVGMAFETAGRSAALAFSPYRQIPSGSEASLLAAQLESIAARIRSRELLGPDAVEAVLWSCAGFLYSTGAEPVAITVTACAVDKEGIVPAHQVREDEDIDERGL